MNRMPTGGRHCLFFTKRKRDLGESLGDGEANAFVCLKWHSCAWMSPLQPADKGSRGVEDVAGVLLDVGGSFFLCSHLGIFLQNMDILNYNLPLLSYWSWLCLRFGSFPNTISVFTCSSRRGNYMWKHSIRRWYFVAFTHKPCVYMGFLRRIQSISPFCDASTSISNDCSKSLCFLQK